MQTVTLFYFEYVANNLGVWTREWFATREAAEQGRIDRAKSLGVNPNRESEMCGEYGDLGDVEETLVECTPEGILTFANNFACDTEG
jgi:hypothetical protein